MTSIPGELVAIVSAIRDWIRQGLKTEEILKRLADPTGVAADMLDRAILRKEAGEAYLGEHPSQDSRAVLVQAEAAVVRKPRRKRRVSVKVRD